MSKEGARIFIATETFSVAPGEFCYRDRTRVREGHPLLARYPGYFKLAEPHYEWPEVEQTTQGPGEKRGATTNA